MQKETKRIVQSNFTSLVIELEDAIKSGFSVIRKGTDSPYHMIMGNFVVTLEKSVDEKKTEMVQDTQTEITQQKGAKKVNSKTKADEVKSEN